MKITHVISDTNIGGAGILLRSVLTSLSERFDFEAIVPKGAELSGTLPASVKITELDVSGDKSFSLRDVKAFYNYFKLNTTDVVHTHASLSARLGAKLAGVRLALSTRHCAIPDASVERKNFIKRLVYRLSTDLTVSTADFATNNLIKEGIPKSRIITIKNGSPDVSEKVKDSHFSAHEELKLPKGTKIIGSVARLEWVKGQDLILRAVPDIVRRVKNVHFLFIGEGGKKSEYQRLAASLGIEKHVTFLGYTPQPWNYQKDFYLNVNASRGTETSCLATSECMALGVPTVASSFGGNTEMICHGENGLIFTSDNVFALKEAILSLLLDEGKRDRLSAEARKSYENSFSLCRMADDYKRLYLSLDNYSKDRRRKIPKRLSRERV